MANGNSSKAVGNAGAWTSAQAYIMAIVCLLIGIAVGYFVRGSAAPDAAIAASGNPSSVATQAAAQGQPDSPEQLQRVAAQQVAPLLERLKTSPNDPVLLAEIGNVYYDAQQYATAIQYYGRSLQADPSNANVRTDMGTAYYYSGDPDRAIAEFNTSLKYDSKHAQTLFNLGMVQWQGKADAKGAVETWQRLLKVAPDYPERARVEQLIQQAKQHTNIAPGTKTNKPATM